MRQVKPKKASLLLATCLAVIAACKGESTVTEYNKDADVVASLNGSSVSDILISVGLVVDSNELRHTARKAGLRNTRLDLIG